MATVSQMAFTGTQGRPAAGCLCPDCGSRLYGAHGLSARPAAIVWLCRTPGCGHVRGALAPLAHRCLCSAVVVPGTGGEFAGPSGPVHICSGCTEIHPGGAPKEILDQHKRTTRAHEQRGDYALRQVTEDGRRSVEVTNTKTQATYTVLPDAEPARCSCPDFTKRCAGTALRCKHLTMVQEWLGEPPTAAPAPEPATPVDLVTTTRDARLADLEARALRAQQALDAKVSAERDAILTEAKASLEAARLAQARSDRDALWPEA